MLEKEGWFNEIFFATISLEVTRGFSQALFRFSEL